MKKVYIFDYKEAWMILLYKDGREEKYWNESEDDWDKTLDIIELLDLPKENIYHYKLESYDHINQLVKDVFEITDDEIKELEKFRK